MRQFLPEWHPQWGVILAWPHGDTDWAPILEHAERTYTALAREILAREALLVLCRDEAHRVRILERLTDSGARIERLRFRILPYDDTWTRDYAPLAVREDGAIRMQDFRFNGWGGKYPAERDDAVSAALPWAVPLEPQSLILEGGSVETDGAGTLLTTSACLLNPNRNPERDRHGLERELATALGIRDIIWLNHGALEGDDTDAHVDTLARFCTPDTIAYVQCTDPADSHFDGLQRMESELREQAAERGLSLVALPWPPACYNDDGERLPATYANFLIINDAVLVPTYGAATDRQALDALTPVFPGREVVGVDCRVLIEQHGSLHCATMQLPEAVIREED